MLEKTLAMLEGIDAGTYLPDDVRCCDPEEIDALGRLLQKLVYCPSSVRRLLQDKYHVTITRADFYSEIPPISELEKSFSKPTLLTLDGIFPDAALMIDELHRLMEAAHEFDPPVKNRRPGEFSWEGGPFSYSDAVAYYAMVRTRRPGTIVEIGSGWSTLIAQSAVEKNGTGRIICIEPYPSDFLKAMPNIELIERRAQDIETEYIKGVLRDGDIVFIDSTHTVRHDSDCLHIYLRLLPAIAADITVHVHDIFLPGPVPLHMMRNHQIYWNEQYLLYAYIASNPRTRAIFGSQYHYSRNRALLDSLMCGRYPAGGASFWFKQTKQ